MNACWPFTKIAIMIVVAIRVITWGDRPTPEFSDLLASPPSPFVMSFPMASRMDLPDGDGEFQ
jgi:hypothetical protein